ncbi:MAG: 50S ribosomal protein L18 [Candidatus Omnitrophica bacterium]|nr:50S ribosomal protein L18 [Candidatus Omnitrophota bacterium]
MLKKGINRRKRHYHIRKKVIGNEAVPRLSVQRSLANLYVQLVDDYNEKTLLALSTTSQEFKQHHSCGGNVKAAVAAGEMLASKMKEKGIERICFDRGGYRFHGRIKALADTLRKNGIVF